MCRVVLVSVKQRISETVMAPSRPARVLLVAVILFFLRSRHFEHSNLQLKGSASLVSSKLERNRISISTGLSCCYRRVEKLAMDL